MIVGNDISSAQGVINWGFYKNNTNFVIMKATEGVGFTDPAFKVNQLAARQAGLPTGYYHFARPDLNNSPIDEAEWFLNNVGTLWEGEFLCLDYEVSWPGDCVAWCKIFMDQVSGRLNGLKSLIYLNQSLVKAHNWQPIVDANYGLWVAAYTYDPNKNVFTTGSWKSAVMQQWTDDETVPGIAGKVDGDVFFGDVVALKAYGYHFPVSEPTPTPEPSPAPSVPTGTTLPTPDPQILALQQQNKDLLAENIQLKLDKAQLALELLNCQKNPFYAIGRWLSGLFS